MKTSTAALIFPLVLTMALLTQVSAKETDSTKVDSEKEYFVIETRHRLFSNFSQIDTVGMEEPYYIGEEEYKGDDEVRQECRGLFVMSPPRFRRENLFACRLVDFNVSEKYIEAPARK